MLLEAEIQFFNGRLTVECFSLFEMRVVALRRCGEEPIVDRRDVLQPLALRLPLDVRVPQPVRPEFQSAGSDRPLELRPDVVLVVRFGRFHVGEVVDPQIDGERNRFQASLEYLYNDQLEKNVNRTPL